MSYIFKFKSNDVFINSIKTHPEVKFDIYQGTAYYNNRLLLSGAFTGSILGGQPGTISLYEENVDRRGSSGLTDVNATEDRPALPSFEAAVIDGTLPEDLYDGPNPVIRPFIIKDGSRLGFRTATAASFNAVAPGGIMALDYPLTATISKEFYDGYGAAAAARYALATVASTDGGPYIATDNGTVTHLFALQNVMDSYTNLSRYYAYSSSQLPAPDLASISGYRTLGPGATTVPVGLVSIPSIFYGSGIKKGTVSLRTYITGTLAAELKDLRRNGELIQVGPTGSVGSASVAGVVLYSEGFVVLTGSWVLDGAGFTSQHTEDYAGSGSDSPRWIYFGQGLNPSGSISTPNTSYQLSFLGTTVTPTLTMLAHARKNQLNHSNNPTYTVSASAAQSGSTGYIQNLKLAIKNVVSASYNTPTGSFEKTTYISQIGIFDENKNLLGIAKLATPVKKTEKREFTFKLKLDI